MFDDNRTAACLSVLRVVALYMDDRPFSDGKYRFVPLHGELPHAEIGDVVAHHPRFGRSERAHCRALSCGYRQPVDEPEVGCGIERSVNPVP